MFDVITHGLDRASERWCLAACFALCMSYMLLLAYLQQDSVRVDKAFFARREQVLLRRVQEHPLPFDQPVTMSDVDEGNSSVALLNGWSSAEPTGVWTDSSEAELAFGLPSVQPTGSIMLRISSSIMLPRGGQQDIGLGLDHSFLGRWHLNTTKAVLCAIIPEQTWPNGTVTRLQISIAKPQRPKGWDHRTLGMRLEQIRISSGTECPAETSTASK